MRRRAVGFSFGELVGLHLAYHFWLQGAIELEQLQVEIYTDT